MRFPKLLFSTIIGMLLFASCGGGGKGQQTACGDVTFKKGNTNEVIIHELADPDKLNPVNSTSAGATYIEYNIFMYLLDVDKEKLEVNPSLAVARPTITKLEEGPYKGGMSLSFEIRPEAMWDNGTPVTAKDVEFTYKAVKNPMVESEQQKPYCDFLVHMDIDPANPKKFTLYTNQLSAEAEFSLGGSCYILPEYVYDPKGIMRKYSIDELSNPANVSKLKADANIIAFAKEFNSEKYQREKGYVVGCGPYQFESWATGQRIILSKKANWWGDQLADKAVNFKALPAKITYEILNDWTTAVTAMKDEGIDVERNIEAKLFSDLNKNEAFKCKYEINTPQELSYVYIGMNMKNPKLQDVRVRKALAYLVNRQQIIDVLNYGFAAPTFGMIHPSKKYYNDQLDPYNFDPSKASTLLDEAGWKDSDGDNIRDKVVNGKKEQLKLVFKYNAENPTRQRIGLFLKEQAKKIGVEIEILGKEWTVFIDETKKHDFELFCGAWISDPISDDPKQIWHTSSADGGSNYVYFGNTRSDQVIDAIRTELDESKRNEYYKEFQKIVNEEVPYIFLYTPKNRLCISKRFENAKAYTARPGYSEREFVVGGAGQRMAAGN
ncbi:MAG: ABC transporter substrate-binding protein [Chitinophagales bacterium]|nr:ABC transporter substrate-binding protein [Chitinophagales bacterium]